MRTALVFLFGVALPVVTLLVEVGTGMCGQAFFDPIPTTWHVLAVALVPIVNLMVLLGLQLHGRRFRTPLLWMNAGIIGVTFVYALIFLPLSIIGIPAILLYGLGFLPLSPLLSFVCAIALRRALTKTPVEEKPSPDEPSRNVANLVFGSLAGVLIVVAPEVPVLWTHQSLTTFAWTEGPSRSRSVVSMRRFGSEQYLLRMCYDDSPRGPLFTRFAMGDVSREHAQQMYFRVTGRPFNSVPKPRNVAGFTRGDWDDFDFDPDLGGEAVAGRRRGLDLVGSRIDGHLHLDAALAYLEWTLEFSNDHRREREARAQIQLPPGGVVSRLTLWVHGEPREAAFAAKSKVREAYRKIAVEQRRDPVLVTWAGQDRVLMQCFPVPPNGGRMKVRLGITAPLEPVDQREGVLVLPAFAERNFSIRHEKPHAIWLDAPGRIEAGTSDLATGQPTQGIFPLRGTVSDAALGSPETAVRVDRDGTPPVAWTADPHQEDRFVVQELVHDEPKPLRPVVLVIDGSQRMREYVDDIADAVDGLPPGMDVKILVASDTVVHLTPSPGTRARFGRDGMRDQLRANLRRGGFDNVPALVEAWDLAAEGQRGAILWVHGPQPVILDPVTPLVQRMERRPDQVVLLDVSVEPGPNRVIEQLGGAGRVAVVPRVGSLKQDLGRVLRDAAGESGRWRLRRRLVEGSEPTEGTRASSHIARLWTRDEVERLSRSPSPGEYEKAMQLAATGQLVTSISAAVVLETQEQYEASDLKPVDRDSTPQVSGVPEPSTFVLAMIALAAVVGYATRRRGR